MLNVLMGVALALLVSSLAAVFATRSARQRGIEEGRRQAIEAYRREQDAAVYLLLSRLGNLISRPCEDKALPARAESIIDLIRAYQNAIAGLIAPMSQQIDRLERALSDLNQHPSKSNAADEVRDAFVTLRVEWPERKVEIELRLRNLLGQLTTIDRHASADLLAYEPTMGPVGSVPNS